MLKEEIEFQLEILKIQHKHENIWSAVSLAPFRFDPFESLAKEERNDGRELETLIGIANLFVLRY